MRIRGQLLCCMARAPVQVLFRAGFCNLARHWYHHSDDGKKNGLLRLGNLWRVRVFVSCLLTLR